MVGSALRRGPLPRSAHSILQLAFDSFLLSFFCSYSPSFAPPSRFLSVCIIILLGLFVDFLALRFSEILSFILSGSAGFSICLVFLLSGVVTLSYNIHAYVTHVV